MTRTMGYFTTAIVCLCIATAFVSAVEAPKQTTGLLNGYALSDGPITIDSIPDDGSAATFNPLTGTLFVCPNNPPAIMELGLDGTHKRTIELVGFEDTEGVTWMSGTKFAILQERRRVMAIANIKADTTVVDIKQCQTYLIDPINAGNKGIEGVTFDAKANCLYIVKEKAPRKIYRVALPTTAGGDTAPTITNPWDIEETGLGMDDVSGVYYHAATGHLLILSDESKCVVETTVDGKEVSRLSFAAGAAGLETEIPQPEGITMDSKGKLYIVCEPNFLFIFSPKAQ